MEQEVNGLTYRYVYGNDRLSVNITGVENGSSKLIENGNQIRLYYHMDYLGTADYLTSPLTGKVESWTHYNEWGEITHNAVLKCGQRELDLVKRYATHDFDAVLNQYYAKARFYDAENRHFTAMDPIKDGYNWYMYCGQNPVIRLDPTGLYYIFQSTDGYYYAVAENSTTSGFAAAVGEIPFIGDWGAEKIQAIQNKGAVSGNSLEKDLGNHATIDGIVSDLGSEYLSDTLDDSIELIFGEAAKEVAGVFGTAFSIVELLEAVRDSGQIPQVDRIIFQLFDLAKIDPKSKSLNKIEATMEAATAYVEAADWLFLDPAYTNITFFIGTAQYSYGPTLFGMLMSLNKMNNSEKIKKAINNYFSDYYCASMRNSELNSIAYVIEEARWEPYYSAPYAQPIGYIFVPAKTEPYVKYALNNYKQAINDIVSGFKNFVENVRDSVSS